MHNLVSPSTRRPPSDDAVVARARAGDQAAFAELHDRYAPRLLGFASGLLGSRADAEDAVQLGLSSAFRHIQGGACPEHLGAWLHTIVRNQCLSQLRARRDCAELPAELDGADGAGTVAEAREDLRLVLADLAKLPEDQRTALLLSSFGELDHGGIAEVLAVKPTKVKALVFQAREALSAQRAARGVDCREIREELSVARDGQLRRGPLRRHLAQCDGCRAFGSEVQAQRAALGLLIPAVPLVGLKDAVLASLGAAGGGVASGGIGAGAGAAGTAAVSGSAAGSGVAVGGGAATAASAGPLAALASSTVATKVAVVAVAAAAGGGLTAVGHHATTSHDPRPRPAVVGSPPPSSSAVAAPGSTGAKPVAAGLTTRPGVTPPATTPGHVVTATHTGPARSAAAPGRTKAATKATRKPASRPSAASKASAAAQALRLSRVGAVARPRRAAQAGRRARPSRRRRRDGRRPRPGRREGRAPAGLRLRPPADRRRPGSPRHRASKRPRRGRMRATPRPTRRAATAHPGPHGPERHRRAVSRDGTMSSGSEDAGAPRP